MAQTTALKAIAGYFNAKDAPNHKPLREFAAEVRMLSDEEKQELAEGICAITGDTLA
jgi:hypothetical protein